MISIIVPVYNTDSYLHQCIDSILNQTYRDLEILLIDDGSTDKSAEICDDYKIKDKRVRVFHTENRGVSVARNLGLRHAHGEYIGFVDSDDWIEPEMFEFLFQKMQETKVDISACEIWIERKNGTQLLNRLHNAIYSYPDSIKALIRFNLYSYLWNKLYRIECWKDIFLPEGQSYEDITTIHKVIQNAQFVFSCSKPFYHYRKRCGGITNSSSINYLMDFWNAYYNRSADLLRISEIKQDQECIDVMDKKIAELSVRFWQTAYCASDKKQCCQFQQKIRRVIKDRFPLFGKKDWNLPLRINIFLIRETGYFSVPILYYSNKFYSKLKKCFSCLVHFFSIEST